MLDELNELQESALFWKEFRNHPEADKLFKKFGDELAEARERWDDIKPADFRDSQSRVRAIKIVLRELKDKSDDVTEALKSKKRQVGSYEIDNEIFLRAAGYEFDIMEDAGKPEPEQEQGATETPEDETD